MKQIAVRLGQRLGLRGRYGDERGERGRRDCAPGQRLAHFCSPVYGATGGPPSAVPCLTARGGGIVPGGEQIYAKRSTAAHQPADRGHELGGLLGLVVLPGAHDAVARVVVEEAE